ncbi:NAD dependent epimerase/dehydratase [Aspergillus bertholletiae]|uniref:NAD dependent epimerase/dehydratase n=1 Tax=Aspergillus bertholletiae TaxID=1226010 RepID=A0A5N7BH27_9EURO|nr:NAD dependent epimerase/dehydratase [Aspergillus bertholletiae]
MSPNSGPHVLLTGANGFVASHILSMLLERGYDVTVTVRSQAKADDILRTHPSWTGRFAVAIVSDFTSAKPFDDLFHNAKRPYNYVIHTASPLNFNVTDIQKEMIEPAVMGTTEILKAAHHYGGSDMKRFVLLGSAVSVLNSFEDLSREGKPYTEKDWNPVTAEQAIERKDAVLGYNVSKKRGEEAAWEFMKQSSPVFDLVVINPDIITGPMLHPISGPKSVNETNQFAIKSFIDGTHKQIDGVMFPFYHFVDVRDVARSHVDALTNPAAGGQRILLISGLISPQLVVNIIRRAFPELRDRVPEGNPSQILPPGVHPTGWDMRVSLDILSQGAKDQKWEYIDLETSVISAVRSMIATKTIRE